MTTSKPSTTTNTASTAASINNQATPGSSDFAKGVNPATAATDYLRGLTKYGYQPRVITSTNTQQSSQSDIIGTINGVMMQMLGRYATNDEISKYGPELLAAERANPSTGVRTLSYGRDTGKGLLGNDVSTNVGVNPADFIANLIRGTGEARDYAAASGYFDAMRQSNDKFRSAFSG